MRVASLLVMACLLAAGCKPAAPAPSIKEKEEVRAAEVAKLKGWDQLFGAPDRAVGAANQFGFHPTPYAAQGKTWRSTGGPVMVAGSYAKKPNQVAFAAEGPSATQIDTIRFELSLTDAETAKDARKRFAKLVRDYLFQAGLDAAPLVPALSQGVPARGDLTGTPYTIDKASADGAEHLTVTFTRTSPTQGN